MKPKCEMEKGSLTSKVPFENEKTAADENQSKTRAGPGQGVQNTQGKSSAEPGQFQKIKPELNKRNNQEQGQKGTRTTAEPNQHQS